MITKFDAWAKRNVSWLCFAGVWVLSLGLHVLNGQPSGDFVSNMRNMVPMILAAIAGAFFGYWVRRP